MGLTCPNCGNERSFLAKTLQTHVVQSGGKELELTEQSRPAVFELLCDECETEIDFGALESDLRREMILLLALTTPSLAVRGESPASHRDPS